MKYTKFKEIPQFTRDGSYAIDCSLPFLKDWVADEQNEGLELNPDFQRGHVWTREQEIAYIEFLLRGGRTGRDLYFNKPSWNNPVPEASGVLGRRRRQSVTSEVIGFVVGRELAMVRARREVL